MNNDTKKAIWSNYQKKIADDNYFYVRSCVRQNFFPGAETTFLKIMNEILHKDIFEEPAHTTCTGIGYHTDILPFETTMTVVARQFSLMNENGYENLVPSCVTSFGIYSEVLETWEQYPQLLEKARKFLKKATGREFEVPKNVAHASDIIYKFRNPLYNCFVLLEFPLEFIYEE